MTLKIGDPAPDFTLPADNGTTVSLADFRGKRVIIFFYPRDNTPGCTAQACGFRDAAMTIEDQNAVVLGISPDGVASHRDFKSQYDLPFLLLADEDHTVAEAYGVWGEQSFAGKTYMGIARSHFVVDEHGVLTDVQVKVSPADSVRLALQSIETGAAM